MARAVKVSGAGHKHHEPDSEKRKELLHELDMELQKNTSEIDLMIKDEDVRRLRVRLLLLSDENTSLRDKVSCIEAMNAQVAERCDHLGSQLASKMEVISSQGEQLRKYERELSSLKTELQVMNDAAKSATDVLSEKLALTRELNSIKPELEHFRSQISQQKTTLAEKLALERQVDTLEVELANEKKASKRATHKREIYERVEHELAQAEKQLKSETTLRKQLEIELAEERHTHQRALQDHNNVRELEDDLRKKLHEAQRQLREEKEARDRIEEVLEAERKMLEKAQKSQRDLNAEDEFRTRIEELEECLAAQQKQAKKSQEKQQHGNAVEDALNARLDEAEAQLSAERKRGEEERDAAQANVAAAEARNAVAEKKMQKLKAKLQETQDQLKQFKLAQTELKKSQKPKPALAEDSLRKTAGRQALNKRKAQELLTDDLAQIDIATPSAEGLRRGVKKRSMEPSMVGEKSTFSITPFLERSKTLGDNATATIEEEVENNGGEEADTTVCPPEKTPIVEVTTTQVAVAVPDDIMATSAEVNPEQGSLAEHVTAESTAAVPAEAPKESRASRSTANKSLKATETAEADAGQVASKPRGRPKKALAETESTKSKTQPKNKSSRAKASKLGGALDDVPEEPEGSQEQQTKTDTARDKAGESSSNGVDGEEKPRKKKRKVLGVNKTIVDDEEAEAEAPTASRKGAKKEAAAAAARASKATASKHDAFASVTISPLKKHRRGVGASFLV